MREAKVVTCFLLRRTERGDEVLVLRRSERVGTYRGRWAGVSGYLEEASPLEQAQREIEEETGLSRREVSLLAEGEPLEVVDESIGVRWTVHPFLFEMITDRLKPVLLKLDWEHVEARWVRPEEVAEMDTVPGLAEALDRVYEHAGDETRGKRKGERGKRR